MKKVIWILGLVVLFSACKDDTPVDNTNNNSNNTASGDLVGTWNLVSIDQRNGEITANGVLVSTYSSESSNEQGTFEFKSDGTVTNTVAYSNKTTVVTGGVPQEQTGDIPSTTTTGTYTYDKAAKMLTITPSTGGKQEITVEELTSSSFKGVYSYSQSSTQAGITSVSSAEVVLTLSR